MYRNCSVLICVSCGTLCFSRISACYGNIWLLWQRLCVSRHKPKTTTTAAATYRGFRYTRFLIYNMTMYSHCTGLLRLLRKQQKRRRLVCTALFHAVVSAGIKIQHVSIIWSFIFLFDQTMSDMFTFYVN